MPSGAAHVSHGGYGVPRELSLDSQVEILRVLGTVALGKRIDCGRTGRIFEPRCYLGREACCQRDSIVRAIARHAGRPSLKRVPAVCWMMRSDVEIRALRCFSRRACSASYSFCCRSNSALRSSSLLCSSARYPPWVAGVLLPAARLPPPFPLGELAA